MKYETIKINIQDYPPYEFEGIILAEHVDYGPECDDCGLHHKAKKAIIYKMKNNRNNNNYLYYFIGEDKHKNVKESDDLYYAERFFIKFPLFMRDIVKLIDNAKSKEAEINQDSPTKTPYKIGDVVCFKVRDTNYVEYGEITDIKKIKGEEVFTIKTKDGVLHDRVASKIQSKSMKKPKYKIGDLVETQDYKGKVKSIIIKKVIDKENQLDFIIYSLSDDAEVTEKQIEDFIAVPKFKKGETVYYVSTNTSYISSNTLKVSYEMGLVIDIQKSIEGFYLYELKFNSGESLIDEQNLYKLEVLPHPTNFFKK